MDEKLLEQLSSSSGIPQLLLSRSIQARAEASGTKPNEVLNSWLGGEPIQNSISVVNENVNVPEVTAENETPILEDSEAKELASTKEEAIETEIVKSTVLTEEKVEPPIELGKKIQKSLKYGSLFGLIVGFLEAIFISSFLFEGLILEAETQNIISQYNSISFLLVITLGFSLFGILNSINIKKYFETNFSGYSIHSSDRESLITGAGLGLIFGAISAFYIMNSVGQTIEAILPEDPIVNLIDVRGAFWRVVILSSIVQAIISSLSMILGVPKGLENEEFLEAEKVRKRIIGSVLVPIASIIFGGLIAFGISLVFLNFHELAPLFALIISAAILIFSSVISSAPKIKVTKTEFIIAFLGVLILIIIIGSIAASQH
jgi:hypothetical protein